MPICAFCKSEETQVHLNGTPICIQCEEKRKPPRTSDQVHSALVSRVAEATAKVNAASQAFNEVLGRFPGGPAHPDGVQNIKNASRELSVAREEMMDAIRRLIDFIQYRTIPDDLKRTG
jgi:hypothetical protein